ncbi:unnamed protein product [Rhodiola kirilowii]
MEVEIISEFSLKPSSPTPPSLRYLKLSILDQLIPSPYAPIVFFYDQIGHDKTRVLKLFRDSLSQILQQFYPLAGVLKDDLTVDCNDEGFRYLEAQVNCHMNDFLTNPDLLMVNKLLPVDVEDDSPGKCVGNVQINVFECGSIAIGLCVSHKILDGAGISIFMNAWAAAARGEFGSISCPNFNSCSVFPPANPWFKEVVSSIWCAMFKPGNFMTRRCVFGSGSIVKLRDEIAITCESSHQRPTRIEAVSALLWKSFIKGSIHKEEDSDAAMKPFLMTHLVNLRRRFLDNNLGITDQTLCNLLWIASATAPARTEPELSDLATKVRASVAKVDTGFTYKLMRDEVKQVILESIKAITEIDSNTLGFTSWCKLGLCEADFGGGRPVWISSIGVRGSMFFNFVLLCDTRDGDGIEAWVTMDESDMDVLCKDSEVGRFASMDPSPIASEYFGVAHHKLV